MMRVHAPWCDSERGEGRQKWTQMSLSRFRPYVKAIEDTDQCFLWPDTGLHTDELRVAGRAGAQIFCGTGSACRRVTHVRFFCSFRAARFASFFAFRRSSWLTPSSSAV
mmetsp:Transcript_6418/g.16671  ORF Transcript_6418/g.16671 Transcript_6418/m.16671 type:complete len:109 (-) Transcript_6418:125-451(-)